MEKPKTEDGREVDGRRKGWRVVGGETVDSSVIYNQC